MIPVLILIAGLIAWLATSYDTIGIILTIIGGTLTAVQALFMLIAARVAGQALRNQQRAIGLFDELDRAPRRGRPVRPRR
jgi:hypothetical protein